jgi:hypothetical protein
MLQAPFRLIPLASLLLCTPGAADVLETRDGRVLEGVYLGGSEQAVRFKAGDEVEVFLVEEVASLRFARTAPRQAAKPRPERPAPPPSPRAEAAAAQAAPAAPKLARVPAGTRLRVRIADGIDARKSAVGDRFGASLEIGLGADGVAILPAGTKLHGQIAELRAAGPVASRLKLELTQLMVQGQPMDIVTGSQQLAEAAEPAPASASTIPVRPGVSSGSLLEFRLLQPFEVRIQ